MIGLIVRKENDHRLGHAQCAGNLRPNGTSWHASAVRATTFRVICVDQRRQPLRTTAYKKSVEVGARSSSPLLDVGRSLKTHRPGFGGAISSNTFLAHRRGVEHFPPSCGFRRRTARAKNALHYVVVIPLPFEERRTKDNANFGSGIFDSELKQSPKTFLLEVPVIGEHVRESLPAHRLHRDAVSQAVAFIGAGEIRDRDRA